MHQFRNKLIMIEIERKFLVDVNNWKPQTTGTRIKQGYLSVDPERVVRVRIEAERAYLTIKGLPDGIARTELEYDIPVNEAEILLKMCVDFPIEKTRFKETVGTVVWEIDVFEGENQGLVLAEVELEYEKQQIELPAWIGDEVSYDKRYFNSRLSVHPFSKW